MSEWINLSSNVLMKDFYDFKDRLVAVIIINNKGYFVKCDFEGHYLMSDDFLNSLEEISYIECFEYNGNGITFLEVAEHTFDVNVLEEINKKMASLYY